MPMINLRTDGRIDPDGSFAKDVQNLTAYCGGKRDERFENILEMTYTNGMCLKKVRREGSFLHLTFRTWWINYSLSPDEEKGNRIVKTGDLIDVTFGRNPLIGKCPDSPSHR